MLISVVLTLSPVERVEAPANLGRAAHAWFLNQIRRNDPALSAALHTDNQERPFTVSNLTTSLDPPQVRESRPQDYRMLEPGMAFKLRVTSYDQQALSQLLEELLIKQTPTEAELDGKLFRVTGVTCDPQVHPWAGRTSYEMLLQETTLSRDPPQRLRMAFGSPTVFHSHNAFVLLPLPKLVFEGLTRRWNARAPARIHEEAPRFAEECIVISRYDLHTERVVYGAGDPNGPMPGFLGQCNYAFRLKDRYWMGLIHLLAAFALYAGVGQHTVTGMGQARLVPERPGPAQPS